MRKPGVTFEDALPSAYKGEPEGFSSKESLCKAKCHLEFGVIFTYFAEKLGFVLILM